MSDQVILIWQRSVSYQTPHSGKMCFSVHLHGNSITAGPYSYSLNSPNVTCCGVAPYRHGDRLHIYSAAARTKVPSSLLVPGEYWQIYLVYSSTVLPRLVGLHHVAIPTKIKAGLSWCWRFTNGGCGVPETVALFYLRYTSSARPGTIFSFESLTFQTFLWTLISSGCTTIIAAAISSNWCCNTDFENLGVPLHPYVALYFLKFVQSIKYTTDWNHPILSFHFLSFWVTINRDSQNTMVWH